MDSFKIEIQPDKPKIFFDKNINVLEIEGESFPENPMEFYQPLFKWLDQYLNENKGEKLIVNMRLIYFNSSSLKEFIRLFEMLDIATVSGKNITLNWFYEEGDTDMLDIGIECRLKVKRLDFNTVKLPNESK